jgi:hypothetical protein
MDQDRKIIQKNIKDKQAFDDANIKIYQSNICKVEKRINGDLRIIQTNTSTIKKQDQSEPGTKPESKEELEQPEVSGNNGDDQPENWEDTSVEPVGLAESALVSESAGLPEPPLLTQSIPDKAFYALETVAGKVKAQVGNKFFKTKLLELISRTKQFLQSGKVPEAIAVLTIIADELEYINNTSSFQKPPVNHVRKSLVEVGKELIDIL